VSTIEELHEAAGRLHACAWHGRTKVAEGSRARFSIPRQKTDDDELIYAAIEELKTLRESEQLLVYLLKMAGLARETVAWALERGVTQHKSKSQEDT
jgi:hypothetical protein